MNLSDLDSALLAARREPPSAATIDAAVMLAADARSASARAGLVSRTARRLGPIGVLAAGSIGLGVLTAAAVYAGAYTGIFGNPFTSTEELDTSEYLDFQAADFPDAVRAIAPDYVVYPGGIDPADVTELVIANAQAAGAAMAQATALIRNFEGYAYCSWGKTWLQQYDAGDTEGAAVAAQHLRKSAQYPATVLTDGGGVVDSMLARADAADRGDRGAVQAEVDTNCVGWGRAGQP